MALRNDEIDLTAQHDALAEARAALADTLLNLAVEAKKAAKVATTKRGNPDLPAVYALVAAVERAEERVDFAILDVQSAAGHDV